MNAIVKLLEGNVKNAEKQGIVWNMAASLAYSLQSALLLLVVTRVGGLTAAGVFSISYSVSQMFASIGSYSMREYQVSDTNNRFGFDTYLTSRYFTIAAMLLTCILYALFHRYSGEKLVVLIFLSVYRAVDGLDDVYHGEYQKRGRLDVAARIFAVRIIASTMIFLMVFFLTKELVFAASAIMISAIMISAAFDHTINQKFCIRGRCNTDGVGALLVSCFPVCIGAFLYSYLINSPKYAIDNILNEEMQAVFNMIFMPVFVISMLGTFVYKPCVLPMGSAWNAGEKSRLLKMILKQALIISVIAAAVVIGGAVLGIPVLSMVYGVDLTQYRAVFVLLLLFGGISTFNTFFGVILTVMRKQIYILLAYVIAIVIDLAWMNRIVEKYALWGAGLVYGLAVSVAFVISFLVIVWEFIKSGTT